MIDHAYRPHLVVLASTARNAHTECEYKYKIFMLNEHGLLQGLLPREESMPSTNLLMSAV